MCYNRVLNLALQSRLCEINMKQLYRWLQLTAAFVCLQFLLNEYVAAQESAARPRALVFDLSGKTIAETKLFKSLPLPPGAFGGGNVFAAKRLYGVVSFPSEMNDVLQMGPGSTPPVDLLLVGEFDSKDERSQMVNDKMVESSEQTKFNGKSFYISPESEDLLLSVEDKRFEGGTKPYLALPRQQLMSAQLKAAMAELGKAPAKLALDLTQNREFLDEAMGMLKQQGVPPMVAPYLNLVKKIDQLMLGIDPDAKEPIKLLTKSANKEDAEFVRKSFDSILGLGKMALGQAPKNDPMAGLVTAMLNGAKIEQKEDRVSLVITKPDGFDEMLEKSLKAAQQAAGEMREMNDMKQMLLAMHNYESTYKQIPFLHEVEDRISAKLSWRVKVLPFIEQFQLFEKFRIDEPWDSENNKAFAEDCPKIIGDKGLSKFCWVESKAKKFADILDGMSNTICMIQVEEGVPWTQPVDISAEDVEKLILGLPDGKTVIIGMYDGSVRRIGNTIDKELLRGLLTINGGERNNEF
jgi:Protein of unknown function (DUF1559)